MVPLHIAVRTELIKCICVKTTNYGLLSSRLVNMEVHYYNNTDRKQNKLQITGNYYALQLAYRLVTCSCSDLTVACYDRMK
jgi:Zn-finger domain-containing protein